MKKITLILVRIDLRKLHIAKSVIAHFRGKYLKYTRLMKSTVVEPHTCDYYKNNIFINKFTKNLK
jgi:hypothetical protein